MKASKVSWYKKTLIIGVMFGLFFAIGCSLPYLANLKVREVIDQAMAPDVEKGEPLNILCLGIDARPGEENARSDTMILASIDPEKNKVALVSIPRDTRVSVPGSGDDKINSANAIGGPRAACRAVEKLMGVNVDYYVLANFQGFVGIVETLGGVTIDVEKRMYTPSEGINLRPGVQHLNGKDALAYVRFRNDALADITRTERQQKFAMALAHEMFQTKTIMKLPTLVPELQKNVKTNMGLQQMIKLAKMASQFEPDNMIGQTLPGYFYDDPNNGLSYWIVDKTKASNLVADLMQGKKATVIAESPIAVPRKKQEVWPDTDSVKGKDKFEAPDVANEWPDSTEPVDSNYPEPQDPLVTPPQETNPYENQQGGASPTAPDMTLPSQQAINPNLLPAPSSSVVSPVPTDINQPAV